MNITLMQDDIIWEDKYANLQKTELQIKNLAGTTDLIVLPEMFSTGFCTHQPDLAETMQGETVRQLKKWSVEFKVAITGSFIAIENGKYYNRAFFVYPTGEIETADKRHLFSMGGEDKFFSRGNKHLIVNYKGFNICVLICYDLRFPVWSRNVDNKYDLLIYTANWPENRIQVWDTLLAARAIENQAYVCGVNRVGEDGKNLRYNGHSKLIDPKGREISSVPQNETAFYTIDISLEELQDFRLKFAVWKDADKFKFS